MDRQRRPARNVRLIADASQMCRTDSRAALRARAARVMALPLEYMPSQEFTAADAAEQILGPMPESTTASRKARRPTGLPPYLASLYEVPLLTAEQEKYVFRKYNFLKYRANLLRHEFDPSHPKLRLLNQIEELFREAVETKNQIIRANLRLVVSIAKKYAVEQNNFFELTSDGNMTLMKAVEKFDYTRGFKFSTYACWALMKNFNAELARETRHNDRFQTGQDERFDWTKDQRSDGYLRVRLQTQHEAQVAKMLHCLTEREQEIISRRYGLDRSVEPQTLAAVGRELGVSKERIRQLEARALAKLRDAAATKTIELL
jgi:RNA polymerase primary sigma factor/RNA polymerase sigma factor